METINWPLTTGCTNLGDGCESCPSMWEYREKGWDYNIQTHPAALSQPLHRKIPAGFTVSLGSDLFHEDVPDDFIREAFSVMNETERHCYEIATKRIERAERMAGELNWSRNIALGTTVENAESKWRIKHLQAIPAGIKFISFLPLLGDVGKLNLDGINGLVAGAEEWGLKRPCSEEWIEGINRQAREKGIVIFKDFNIYV